MTTDGLRERKKQATRQALHEAAVRLVRAFGPQAVTVDAICADAGVSRRTFFNYFDSKEQALFPWDEARGVRIIAAIRDHDPAASPYAAARHAVREMFHASLKDPDQNRPMDLAQAHPELLAAALRTGSLFEQAIADGVAARTGRPADDLCVQTVAAAVAAAVRIVSRNWSTGTERQLDDLVDQVFDALATGANAVSPRTPRRR